MPTYTESGIAQYNSAHPYVQDGHLLRLSFSTYVPVITPTDQYDLNYWSIYHYASGGQVYRPTPGYEAYGHIYDPVGVASLQSGNKYYLYCSANNTRCIVNNRQHDYKMVTGTNNKLGIGITIAAGASVTGTFVDNPSYSVVSSMNSSQISQHFYPIVNPVMVSGSKRSMFLIEATQPFQLWSERIYHDGSPMDAYYWRGQRYYEE